MHMLSKFKESGVIVEGRHDRLALAEIGVRSYTYESIIRGAEPDSEEAILLTDSDRRGMEKSEKLAQLLNEKGYKVDESTGRQFLRMLNVSCAEEILAPLAEMLENGEDNGKNIFRHSKVHGGSEVRDRRHGRQA